jgi:hypothetical protein
LELGFCLLLLDFAHVAAEFGPKELKRHLFDILRWKGSAQYGVGGKAPVRFFEGAAIRLQNLK